MVDKELSSLRKELAARKAQVSKTQKQRMAREQIAREKKLLRRELILLKNPKKIAFAKKAARGFKKTSIRVGKATLKQARLIKEQQERDDRLFEAKAKFAKRKGKKVTKRIKKPKKLKRRDTTLLETGVLSIPDFF